MPWYVWLIMLLVIGSVVASLLKLRSTARQIPLTDEQKQRIAERNARFDAEDRSQDR